ncbi:MAG: DUF4339 domain-containing protein, partial [Deltaproteobacteria bacterium]|nr:DUF4339 domain-containing protein [Deltaproteobacteria bacterium]
NKCKAKYTISADRVQGRVLKIRCRECGDILEIRGDGLAAGVLLDGGSRRKAGSSKDLSENYKLSSLKDRFKESFTAKGTGQLPGHDPLEQPTSMDDFPLERSSHEDAAHETKDPKRWYVAVRNQPVGPVSKTKIRSYLRRNEVEPKALVWREGFDDWKPLAACPELADLVEGDKPAPDIAPASAGVSPPPPGPSADQGEAEAMRGFHVGRIDAQQNVAEVLAAGDALEHDVFKAASPVVEKEPTFVERLMNSRIALICIGSVALLIPFGITMLVVGRDGGGAETEAEALVSVEDEQPYSDHSERGNILAGLTITLEEVIEEELATEKQKAGTLKTNGLPRGKQKKLQGGEDELQEHPEVLREGPRKGHGHEGRHQGQDARERGIEWNGDQGEGHPDHELRQLPHAVHREGPQGLDLPEGRRPVRVHLPCAPHAEALAGIGRKGEKCMEPRPFSRWACPPPCSPSSSRCRSLP